MTFLEAKRGRPKKGSEEESNIEPISVQLQKRSNNASVSVQFHDGSKHEIPREHANKALSMLNSLKPGPRGDAHAAMSKSKEHFYNTLKGHSFAPVAKPKVSLGSMKEEVELDEKRGLWDNIHAKRKRIKAGSGEKMRKPGSPGAPTEQDFAAASESVEPVNELTKKTLASYMDKSQKDTKKLRIAGHAMAAAKHTPGLSDLILKNKKLKVPASDAYNEEVEQVNEKNENQYIEVINKFTGAKSHHEVHPSKAFDALNKHKGLWSTKSARIVSGKEAQSIKSSKMKKEEFDLDEEFSVAKHPVHGKILHHKGKPFLGSYDQADAHAAKHKGTLIKSLNPKKYMVKMPETKPTGDINEESNLKESNLQIVNKAVSYIKTRKD